MRSCCCIVWEDVREPLYVFRLCWLFIPLLSLTLPSSLPFSSFVFFFFFQIGAYLIQTPHFNRRSTLSIFTVLTALSTLAFAAVSSKGGVIVSSMAISLAGSVMYSVLYAMTPEVSFEVLKGLRREEEEGKKKRRT